MKKWILFSSLFIMLIAGCNQEQLSPLQRKQLESKDLQGKYVDAYHSTLQVLQDYGYAIKNTDYDSGVIHGETGIDRNFWGDMRWTEISATLEQFSENIVKVRMSIINKEKKSSRYGTDEKSTIVETPEIFSKMYDEIQKEMFIRQNINK
jgi:hypothetical protein